MSALWFARLLLWAHFVVYPLGHPPRDGGWALLAQVVGWVGPPLYFEFLAWADRRAAARKTLGLTEGDDGAAE